MFNRRKLIGGRHSRITLSHMGRWTVSKWVRAGLSLMIMSVAFVAYSANVSSASSTKVAPKVKAASLTLQVNLPVGNSLDVYVNAWLARLHSATKGLIKVTQYQENTLYSADNSVAATQANEVNMNFIDAGALATSLTGFATANLPMAGINDSTLEKYTGPGSPVFAVISRYASQHGLVMVPTPAFISGSQSMLLKSPITSLSQIAGQSIRSIGGSADLFLQGLGADPVDLTATEVPSAMETGAISGAFTALSVMSGSYAGLGTEDVDFGNDLPDQYYLVISKSEWNKLAPADRKALESTFEAEYKAFAPVASSVETTAETQWLATKGNTIYRPTAAENVTINKVAASIWASFKTSNPVFYKAAIAAVTKFHITAAPVR